MLARTALPVPRQPCCASASARAAAHTLHRARLLVVSRASYATRSSSPMGESWRSSWRTELEHGSNGNGNGAHANSEDEYHTAHSGSGNGYHADTPAWGTVAWREQDEANGHAVAYDWQRAEEPSQAYGWDSAADTSATTGEEETALDEEEDASNNGFFTDAFKEALKTALQRSPLYGDMVGSGDEETVEPQPYENEVETHDKPIFTDQFRAALRESLARQQAELDTHGGYGSDDEYTPTPYVPAPPPRREMSPMEEVIATALGASQLSLRRLNLMKNEIEAAIEREAKQIERLEFALSKTQSDAAYYQSLERMIEELRRRQ